jgi:hypothetical protein
LDVASYQGPHPDYTGRAFVFIKVTEGTVYVNPDWLTQLADARTRGLVVGFYHFPHALADIGAQVEFMLATLGPHLRSGDMLSLDWETAPDGSWSSGAWKDTFLKALASAAPGHRTVLYCNRDFWTNKDTTGYVGDALWIADPSSPAGTPAIKAPWVFHQYGQDHQGADVNVANFPTPGALKDWADPIPPSTGGTTMTAVDLTPAGANLAADETLGRTLGPIATPTFIGPISLGKITASELAFRTAVLAALAALTVPTVDAAALATALAGNQGFVDAIATAVVKQTAVKLGA